MTFQILQLYILIGMFVQTDGALAIFDSIVIDSNGITQRKRCFHYNDSESYCMRLLQTFCPLMGTSIVFLSSEICTTPAKLGISKSCLSRYFVRFLRFACDKCYPAHHSSIKTCVQWLEYMLGIMLCFCLFPSTLKR